MAAGHAETLLRHVRKLAVPEGVARLSDGDLVARFAAQGDEVAFEVLVKRYGPMVLRVCRRVLGNEHDAEDAFQAAFLVLASKASAGFAPESLGAWLHKVAVQVAGQGRRAALRRRTHEGRAASKSAAEAMTDLSVREVYG